MRGDTLVTVSGTGLADGTNYTCRYLLANLSSEDFDLDNYAFSVAQSNGSVPTMLTPATYDGGDLKCVAARRHGGLRSWWSHTTRMRRRRSTLSITTSPSPPTAAGARAQPDDGRLGGGTR